MSMLVSEAEERQWYATSLAGKAAWLQKFWDRYAALAGLSIERRLAEHFMRAEQLENSGEGVQNPVMTARETDTTRVAPNFINAILGIKGMASIVAVNPEMVNTIRHGDATRTGRFLYCAPGWDTLDEVKANMKGWITQTFPDERIVQHKPTGTADGSSASPPSSFTRAAPALMSSTSK